MGSHSYLRFLLFSVALGCGARAQSESPPSGAPATEDWSWHAQSTVIEQWHGAFAAPYSGLDSLSPRREDKHTLTATGFFARRLWPGAELYYDPEFSQGTGLSNTVGIAGFPNGEATRAGATSIEYNTARLFLRQTFGFGGERESAEADQHQLAGTRDVDRLVVTVGKLSAADVFDTNRFSHDPRTQFLNWSLMDNAAWDYPADVKGYTAGATVEWNQAARTLRWGVFMEPAVANERRLDSRVAAAHGQVLEWEERYTLDGLRGAIRPMVYWNRAHMGSYDAALRMAEPDVTQSRRYRSKAGAGLNWEQDLGGDIGAFARIGFNDGQNETWAFTEVDRTVSVGISVKGAAWRREGDNVGIAAVANGLSGPHRRYLAAGGYGFIVGDGRLAYASEQTLETYYNWQPAKWFGLAFDYQWTRNPGYNRDRGPVSIFGLRAHLER